MRLLSASRLRLYYGELEIFRDIDLEITEGDRIGIVGPNGAGKTSLLRVLVGELETNGGSVSRTGGLRVGYVPQAPEMSPDRTLRGEIMQAFEPLRRLEDKLTDAGLAIQMASEGERRHAERRYSDLLRQYEALGGYDYQSQMERVVAGLGLSAETLNTPAPSASGGERTRAALAKALLADPDLLLLDEPTNYLDFDGLAWLESFLSRFSHAFVVVSHDRYFLDQTVNQVWELDNGRLQVFRGNYTKYRALKEEQTRRQLAQYERQQEYMAKEEAFIQRYRAGQRAREARGRAKRLERVERVERLQSQDAIYVDGVDASRTGHVVLDLHGLVAGFQDNGRTVPLVTVPSLTLERGSRTAVVGSNGIGKTTLMRTILGILPPLSGSATLGHNVEAGYFHQGSTDLPADASVLDALLDARNLPLAEARSYLARFLFRGDDVFKPVSALSGGERSRLALARLLLTAPNFLALDEPTTHLDIPSREALEQALLDYNGTLLFVSHDRRLISLLAQQLWVIRDGTLESFQGTFQEWRQAEQRKAAAQAPARRTPERQRQAIARPQQAREAAPDHERLISELEARLAEIERQLQKASEAQNVHDVARLGDEYADVQAKLERTWQDWADHSD